MQDVHEGELVQQAQKGHPKAIGQLYDQHHERIFRYIWSRVGQEKLAEDLTGEVFMRMMANLRDYRQTGQPFQAWLYRIAHNLIVDYFRQEGGNTMMPLEAAEQVHEYMDSPETLVERVIKVEQIQQALDRLDPIQREVVVLRFLVGLSLQEVAETVNKTVAATKSLQHRGLTFLRLELQQEG